MISGLLSELKEIQILITSILISFKSILFNPEQIIAGSN
jgi:hypothetical protein